jgi:hypothetical protein
MGSKSCNASTTTAFWESAITESLLRNSPGRATCGSLELSPKTFSSIAAATSGALALTNSWMCQPPKETKECTSAYGNPTTGSTKDGRFIELAKSLSLKALRLIST